MPLINCPDCNKEISPRATACIHCGAPIKPTMAKSVERGVQRSKLKESMGYATALVAIMAAVPLGMIYGAGVGWSVVFVGIVLGVIITHS